MWITWQWLVLYSTCMPETLCSVTSYVASSYMQLCFSLNFLLRIFQASIIQRQMHCLEVIFLSFTLFSLRYHSKQFPTFCTACSSFNHRIGTAATGCHSSGDLYDWYCPSTAAAYRSGLQCFLTFCLENNLSLPSLRAGSVSVCGFSISAKLSR